MTIEKNFAESADYKALDDAGKLKFLEEAAAESVEALEKAQADLEAANKTAAEAKQAAEGSKTAAESLKAAEQRIAVLEGNARRSRFAELIREPRWPGDAEKVISRLEKFAEMYGEDSQEFKDYVEEQKALAVQLAQSAIFQEVGHSQTAAEGSEFRQALKVYQEANPGKTEAEAMEAVLNANPKFYEQYRKQMNEAAAKGASDSVKI